MSTIFKYSEKDIIQLLNSCRTDSKNKFIFKYMPVEDKILEAGCGAGRYVIYLSKKKYDIQGLEINGEIIKVLKKKYPKLRFVQGDILSLPYESNYFGGILCFGVVEHFIKGPREALKEIYRVLKPGGYAIITASSFNALIQMKSIVKLDMLKKIKNRRYKFKLTPAFNDFHKYMIKSEDHEDFYGYMFKKREFEREIEKSGFRIVESVPIYHKLGLYNEFGRMFVSRESYTNFKVNRLGKIINNICTKIPFLHNHMHLCIATK